MYENRAKINIINSLGQDGSGVPVKREEKGDNKTRVRPRP
jgi:hypothetical protein